MKHWSGAGAPGLPPAASLALEAAHIVTYFSRRWAIETAFAQVRAHLGVEKGSHTLQVFNVGGQKRSCCWAVSVQECYRNRAELLCAILWFMS